MDKILKAALLICAALATVALLLNYILPCSSEEEE